MGALGVGLVAENRGAVEVGAWKGAGWRGGGGAEKGGGKRGNGETKQIHPEKMRALPYARSRCVRAPVLLREKVRRAAPLAAAAAAWRSKQHELRRPPAPTPRLAGTEGSARCRGASFFIPAEVLLVFALCSARGHGAV